MKWIRPACLLLPVLACHVETASPDPDTASYDFYAPGTVTSRFADAGKTYLPRRNLWLLSHLGALSAAEASVAKRVDGIIANRPADGWVSVDELIRAEQGDKWPAFLDDEQALFPNLWALMAAPAEKGPDMADFSLPKPEDLSTSATSAVPLVLTIAELPPELQTTARRLERLFDQDGNDDTVAVADAEAAIAQPSAFTPAELADLQKLAALLRARATNIAGRALVRVPAPEKTEHKLYDDRGLSIVATRSVSFSGSRTVGIGPVGWRGPFPPDLPVHTKVTMNVSQEAVLSPPPGVTVVIVQSTGETCVFEAPTQLSTTKHLCVEKTPVAIELWKGGQRVGSSFALLTYAHTNTFAVDVSTYADYDFVLPDGTQLVQNWTRTEKGDGYTGLRGAKAEFVYERAPRQVPGVDAAIVAKTAPPTFELPFGRYRVRFGDDVFEAEIKPNGIVYAGVNRYTPPTKLERLWPALGDYQKSWVRLRELPNGGFADEPERPGLRPDGTVLLNTGFPKLTAANRL